MDNGPAWVLGFFMRSLRGHATRFLKESITHLGEIFRHLGLCIKNCGVGGFLLNGARIIHVEMRVYRTRGSTGFRDTDGLMYQMD
jgi:hypothetical protein